jgi:predicted DsbA family dithiol-disulfide isomerase
MQVSLLQRASQLMTAINVTCVVDFMCPWSFIGLRSLELALKQAPFANLNVDVQLVPFEFDAPGTYPTEGTDWTDYCKSYGPQKAAFLLQEKLPRAFRLGKEIGIDFDIRRRIVHTPNVNAALMLVQEEGKNGMEFSLQMLHHHFEELRDPNNVELLTKVLTQNMGVSSDRVATFWKETDKAIRNEQWTQQGRSLGAPPVPLFIITFGKSEENLCKRLRNEGPTSPDYFRKLFEICQTSDGSKEL